MDSQSYENDEEYVSKPSSKQSNVLQLWGNERTMNLNPLILTNIQSSHYFKVNLYELKTYHEVVDEIYYKVTHLEPWEKGSRRTSGQTGMCGGVRGVGAGGIVSTAYCLLYKLFTLKLTRKQLNGLITHCDSPYIRALGFMYVRHVLPPAHLLDWYGPYLEDEEELDVKAGGGQNMRIGTMLRQFLVELNWYGSLFPRIPVPIEQKIQKFLKDKYPVQQQQQQPPQAMPMREREQRSDWQRSDRDWKEEKREERDKDRGYRDDRERNRERNRDDRRTGREHDHKHRDYRDRSPRRERNSNEERNRERSHRHNSRDKEYKHRRDRYH
ncbi:pre-mRNA-splicing factor 38B [Onthophagus taurus]|uniref:pre-mRNA-splicing factor 38B n=1 Tax=Onthophagus taurus TaxID=166361 RepID=UPI0039BDF9C3